MILWSNFVIIQAHCTFKIKEHFRSLRHIQILPTVVEHGIMPPPKKLHWKHNANCLSAASSTWNGFLSSLSFKTSHYPRKSTAWSDTWSECSDLTQKTVTSLEKDLPTESSLYFLWCSAKYFFSKNNVR